MPENAPPAPVNIRRLGLVCLGLILLALLPSVPLGCVVPALRVAGGAVGSGALLGFCLAGITRTRRPGLIYLLLAVGLLALWPLFAAWPPASESEIHPWPGAPALVLSYFDLLRSALFVLAVPYPYAAFGFHEKDES